jgi:phosphoribosylaminoimidazole-succinocarboxamide synthase
MLQSDIKSLPFLHRGKVRDIYAVGDDRLLVIQTDRLSAFDVILDDPIPEKGRVLTTLSNFWFQKLGHVVPNHLTGTDPATVVSPTERAQVEGRAMVVHRLKPLMIEAVVRGYVVGSGWKEYQQSGTICGIRLPAGLPQAAKLPEPIFTPATKAPAGEHDENIPFEEAAQVIGRANAEKVRAISLRLYREAADFAATKGIIIADTKFEFGTNERGEIVLIDEILTPDSSRFWPASEYRTGISPPSFDKQFVRDWLETQAWNKKAPAPRLPTDVLNRTSSKYQEALRLLMA